MSRRIAAVFISCFRMFFFATHRSFFEIGDIICIVCICCDIKNEDVPSDILFKVYIMKKRGIFSLCPVYFRFILIYKKFFTSGGVDLVAKIVVVYGPMEGMVHDRRRR
jgi:hypothetical protein